MNLLEVLGKVGFDWQVALANFVNFLIVFFILKKYAFKPIKKIIDERKAKIEKGLLDAQKAETDLTVASTKREEIINEAKKEAALIVSQASENKAQIINDAKDKASIEARAILDSAHKEIASEKGRLEREIKEKAVGLVLLATEKLIKENMNSEKNEKFIREIIGA